MIKSVHHEGHQGHGKTDESFNTKDTKDTKEKNGNISAGEVAQRVGDKALTPARLLFSF